MQYLILVSAMAVVQNLVHSHFSNNSKIISKEDRSHGGEDAHEELVELWSENHDDGFSKYINRERSTARGKNDKRNFTGEGLERHTYSLGE